MRNSSNARIDLEADVLVDEPGHGAALRLECAYDRADFGWGDRVRHRAFIPHGRHIQRRLPFDRRILYGLLGLAMLRDGEAAGLRWSRVRLDAKPLGRITVVASYDHDTTKTEAERWMPIHPVLNAMLLVWKHSAWEAMMGRPPTDDDLVVPCPAPTNRGPRKPLGAMRDRHYIWKRLQSDLALLGFRPRRVHDLRRTGISLAIDGGADDALLKRGTHAAPKHVMGLYTSVSWESLCREVGKLDLTGEGKVVQLGPVVRRVRQRPRATSFASR